MRKVPVAVPELVLVQLLLPVSVQVPVITPLLSVPMVVVVPFDLPVRLPLSASVLPGGLDFTVKVNGPVTTLLALVVRVAVALGVCVATKHDPAFKKTISVTVKVWSGFTENEVTKFSRLASPVPPVRVASQGVLGEVTEAVVLVPQPMMTSASPIRAKSATIFMKGPRIVHTENREMQADTSMDASEFCELATDPRGVCPEHSVHLLTTSKRN
jgi:hypothetical protein